MEIAETGLTPIPLPQAVVIAAMKPTASSDEWMSSVTIGSERSQ